MGSPVLKPAALRVDDAAKYAGISRSKLYALIKSGEVASLLVGGRRLLRRETLETYLLTQEQRSTEA
ncbi:excisionase [Brevundimonas sp.]|uniref:excisionase n=1 Tax=Brevundimonas sp. TaxID=1871086 RepID=UPI003FA59E0C